MDKAAKKYRGGMHQQNADLCKENKKEDTAARDPDGKDLPVGSMRAQQAPQVRAIRDKLAR